MRGARAVFVLISCVLNRLYGTYICDYLFQTLPTLFVLRFLFLTIFIFTYFGSTRSIFYVYLLRSITITLFLSHDTVARARASFFIDRCKGVKWCRTWEKMPYTLRLQSEKSAGGWPIIRTAHSVVTFTTYRPYYQIGASCRPALRIYKSAAYKHFLFIMWKSTDLFFYESVVTSRIPVTNKYIYAHMWLFKVCNRRIIITVPCIRNDTALLACSYY